MLWTLGTGIGILPAGDGILPPQKVRKNINEEPVKQDIRGNRMKPQRVFQRIYRFWTPAALILLPIIGWYFGSRPSEPIGVAASASCETAGVTLSTGSFNSDTEALFYLDSQGGSLTAGLLSRTDPGFVKTYKRNVKADLQQIVSTLSNASMPRNPSFLMVTGDGDTRKVGAAENNSLSKCFIYVAEINTGIVLVYAIPVEGDRDIAVEWGDLILWSSARLSNGFPNASAAAVSAPKPGDQAGAPLRP